jgi:hypothetical protein
MEKVENTEYIMKEIVSSDLPVEDPNMTSKNWGMNPDVSQSVERRSNPVCLSYSIAVSFFNLSPLTLPDFVPPERHLSGWHSGGL